MNAAPRLLNFHKDAVEAFPSEYRAAAEQAAAALLPFVDYSYRKTPIEVTASGRSIRIPSRVHYKALDLASLDVEGDERFAAICLCTRSTDGYLRHAALQNIVRSQHREAIPFVVLLAGEYVVEIIECIVAALPALDQSAYANFVHENRPVIRRLRSKATSYWNEYYRPAYGSPATYPGLLVLDEIERWAS